MTLDPDTLAALVCSFRPSRYLRVTRWEFRATPLGLGFGDTRFASPKRAFRLLYIAEDLSTSLAETVIRDRFEGSAKRQLTRGEVAEWGVCEVDAVSPLRVLDLTGDGCLALGVSSDIVGAKAQEEARSFSRALYDATDLDGILYTSRLRKQKKCVAVYDRAVAPKLHAGPIVRMETLADMILSLKRLRIELI